MSNAERLNSEGRTMADNDNGQSGRPARCPRCEGKLAFYLRTPPKKEAEPAHRIYRCEACSHFEWVAEAPGKRT